MSASGGLSEDPSTATNNMQDVKELIPEFFVLPGTLNTTFPYFLYTGITSNVYRFFMQYK